MTDRFGTKRGETQKAVRLWAGKTRLAVEKRNANILRMYEEGASLREIAAVAGMSHSGVQRILESENVLRRQAGEPVSS